MNILQIERVELEALRGDAGFLQKYSALKELLRSSNIINILRQFGRPIISDGGSNIYRTATQAAFSSGYNQALDDMLYFKELYLQEASTKPSDVRAHFGAIGIAVTKGDLTQEDLK